MSVATNNPIEKDADDCSIKPEDDGLLFFLHVVGCSDCKNKHTIFYAYQLGLRCPS